MMSHFSIQTDTHLGVFENMLDTTTKKKLRLAATAGIYRN